MGRERFLTKYTGWSRIRFIDAIAPDALYVNVVRDGRAVAASLLNVYFWHGWGGPDQWRWGPLSPEDQELWDRSDRSFFVLAGLQWKRLMENYAEQCPAIGNRYFELRYEDLVSAPRETLTRLLQWAGLREEEKFFRRLAAREWRDSNVKWRTELPSVEQRRFEELLGPTLERFGYTVSQTAAT